MQRLLNMLIALDQLAFSIITLGSSATDETLSAAAFSTDQDGKFWGKFWRPKIDAIFRRWQPNHCRGEFELEQKWNRTFNE